MRPLSLALWLSAAFAAACGIPQPVGVLTPLTASSAPAPSSTASPAASPSTDPVATAVLRLLLARDAAWRAGDVAAALALVAPDAPASFREHERQLAALATVGVAIIPLRGPVVSTSDVAGMRSATVVETDSQGRTRQLRYFATGALDGLRLSEPTLGALGALALTQRDRFDIRAYPLDAGGCDAATGYAQAALPALVATLGEAYLPAARISYECLPTVQAELPPLASAYTRGNAVTLLTSQSTVVRIGPGAEWSRTVVTHELAHVLLFARGTGPFVLLEGIPLWLTDDRRQPELDRLVQRNAIWSLDHLVAGPTDDTEFFAAYAQASSFVRFLARTYGVPAVVSAWENGRLVTFGAAFVRGFGITPEEAYLAWRASLTR